MKDQHIADDLLQSLKAAAPIVDWIVEPPTDPLSEQYLAHCFVIYATLPITNHPVKMRSTFTRSQITTMSAIEIRALAQEMLHALVDKLIDWVPSGWTGTPR